MKKIFSYLTLTIIMLSASVSLFSQIRMPENMPQGEMFAIEKTESQGVRKNARRAGENTPYLQGYVNYNTDNKIGWYTMNKNGETSFVWVDMLATEKASPMVMGWMRNNKICGVSSRYESGILYTYDYIEIDLATGEYTKHEPIKMRNEDNTADFTNYYRVAAYDPYSDRIYGYGYSADGKKFVFKSSSYDFSETTIIREISDEEFCSSITFNTQEKRLVGFNRVEFVAIDSNTGNQSVLYYPEISNFLYTYSGLVYDKTSRSYYWNYFTKDNKSHLVSVDFNAKKMTKVCDYTNMTQFSFIVPMSEDVDPTAPEAPVISEVKFEKNSLSGSIAFSLPLKSNNGDALASDAAVAWTLDIDGVEYATGTGVPGGEVSQNIDNLTEGSHSFLVAASVDGKESDLAVAIKYVGNDTPVAPENVVLNEAKITWAAVVDGINGGYIDCESIEYEVTLNGITIGTTKETSIDAKYPENAEYRDYTAKVVAKIGDKVSAAGSSNYYLFGKPLSLPKSFSPEVADGRLFSVEDKDGDGNVWKHNEGARGSEFFISGKGTTVDEWLFLPPLNCNSTSTVYSISFNAALLAETDASAKIEVYAGSAANSKDMTVEVISLVDITKTSLTEFAGLFTPTASMAADGVVLGIHVSAPHGNAQVKTRNFKIAATSLSPKAPKNMTDVEVKAKAKGELKADVTFTLPVKLIDGTLIAADTDISVDVRGDTKTTVTGKPGTKQTATVECYQGFNEIEVTPYIGSDKGQKRVYDVYAGYDIPAGVQNFTVTISEDNYAAYCTWTPPVEGVNGGYVNPDDIVYWLCNYDKNTQSYKPYAELGKECVYNTGVNVGTRLATYQFAIQAVAGAGKSPVYVPARIQLGKPYTLNIDERFVDADMEPKINYPITVDAAGKYADTEWKISNPEEYNPAYSAPYGVALIGTNEAGGTVGCVQFAKFSTKDLPDASVAFYVYQSKNTPKITVWANTYGMIEDEKLGELSTTGEGYTKKTVALPEKYLDKQWVSIYLTVDYTETGQNVLISRYIFSSTATAVSDVTDNGSSVVIIPVDGGAMITGAEGLSIDVYSLDGMILTRIPVAASEEVINLKQGLYIVRAGDKTTKIYVR